MRVPSTPLVLRFAAVLLVMGPMRVSAQQVSGATYDTRDPRTCAERTAPARGAIPAALAMQYFVCESEREFGNSLYLIENLQLQVGAPRPFQMRTDAATDVDPSQPVYPIRGSFTLYQCKEPSKLANNKGKNCSVYDKPKATGTCYKTSFGEWHCSMADLVSSSNVRHSVAPPR